MWVSTRVFHRLASWLPGRHHSLKLSPSTPCRLIRSFLMWIVLCWCAHVNIEASFKNRRIDLMCILRYICLTIVSSLAGPGDNSWYDRSGVVWSFQNMKQSIWYVQPVLTIFHVIFVSNRVQLSQEKSVAVIYWWDHFHRCQGSPVSAKISSGPGSSALLGLLL